MHTGCRYFVFENTSLGVAPLCGTVHRRAKMRRMNTPVSPALALQRVPLFVSS